MLPLVVASEIVDQRLPLDSIVGSQWVGRRLVIIEMLFSDPSDRTIKGSMYKHPAIQAMTEATVFKNLLANAVQYPELFNDVPQPLDDDPAPNQPPRKPQFLVVAITVFISVVRALLEPLFAPSTGHGLTRTLPPSFLARKFQELITEKAR
ncbi:hypothetical protein B0H14DRAFT_2819274 [Mycena olivaceomarginata]|nr:hypothetical protein B0H14DRAFT_2819274 [Mycena olivaceomarginata]